MADTGSVVKRGIVNGHVAFVTPEGRGHAVPVFQLANVLAEKFGCVSTVVWVVHTPATIEAMAKQQRRAGKVEVLIIQSESPDFLGASDRDFWRREMLPKIHGAIEACGRPLTAVIGDFMLASCSLLKEEFKVPFWQFFVSPLAFVSIMYEFHCNSEAVDKDGIQYPDIGVIEREDLPTRNEKFDIVELARRAIDDISKGDGILVNDCQEVYSQEFFDFVTRKVPHIGPVLTIGPIAAYDPRLSQSLPNDESISWLNSKPPRSVVFCALGSVWSLPPEDACTLAKANAACGKYVLWAHRKPDPKLAALSAGFFTRAKVPDDYEPDTGLPKNYSAENVLISPWVNQPAVLTHPAVACFVSHCGWNSAAEAMAFGTPVVCLPISADQPLVAKIIERHLKSGKPVWYGPNQGALDGRKYVDTINEVCGDPTYLANARRIQEAIHNSVHSPDGLGNKNLDKFAAALNN